ncbi:type II secretion system F family protein [Rubrobacter indicoceani]|uniref:type II secretion system F family protein n=1 Tax=Rubrobacter indicoceani TaxID=2051957 RepID=UPI000E5B2C23|nr:type II secretion system F family protein [Rubrobacter indicoceani]
METYRYRARGRDGEILTDSIQARDLDAAAGRLKDRGLLVIHVERQSGGERPRFREIEFFGRVRTGDIVVFTRQLATMVEAGIPLVRALSVLGDQSESPKFGEVISSVRRDVEGGSSFSDALRKREDIFGRLYGEMVRAGEYGGSLDGVLLRIATQLEREQTLRRQVRAAVTYPVFVLVASVVAAIFMLTFVVPVFEGMYADLGGELPLPTQVAVFLSDTLIGFAGLVLLGACVAGALWIRRRLASEAGRARLQALLLRMPLGFGKLMRKVALARVSRTLGSLVAAGVPVLVAIEITASASGNAVVEAALLRSREAVGRGAEINAALAAEGIFPNMMTRMVAVGETTGNLDGMLSKVADFYEAEVESAVASLTSMIEPVLILLVGGIVGATIVSMYLPMFRVFELIN